MIPLLAEGEAFAIPWPIAVVIGGALCTAIGVLWKSYVGAILARAGLAEEYAKQARSEGAAWATALADASLSMRNLGEQIAESDKQRVLLAENFAAKIDNSTEELRTEIAKLRRKAGV